MPDFVLLVDSITAVLFTMRNEKVRAMWDKSLLPFELWLRRGRPLHPYLRRVIIDHLRKGMRAKLIPDELFVQTGMKDFLEWSSLRVWMKSWLRYCHWYYTTALSPDVGIEQFFSVPEVNSSWKIVKKEKNLLRSFIVSKIYDMVAVKGVDFRLPRLESTSLSINGGYLLASFSGADSLVQAVGCDQLAANRSIIIPGGCKHFN